MKIQYFFPVLIVITLVSIVSCKQYGHKNMDEGEIFYTIKYIRNPSSFSEDMLPKDMIISFKDNKVSSEFKTHIGNTGISTVVNPGKGIYDTYVNLMAFKFRFEGTPKQNLTGFSSMQGIKYKETGRTKDICGFNCRELETFLPGDSVSRSVWYTKEIDIKDPNVLNPYNEIDGVLLDFFYVIGGAEFRMIAQEVYVKDVPEKYFEKKKNYESVSEGYLDTLIMKLITF